MEHINNDLFVNYYNTRRYSDDDDANFLKLSTN